MINLNGTTTGYGANTAELANADIRIGNGAAPTNGLYSPGANQLAISTNGAQRATVDASGRLLVGTSTARNSLFNVVNTYGGLFQVEGTGQFGGTRGAAVITNNSSSAGAFPYLALARANGDSIGSTTIVSNGHTVGALSFQGCDGLEFVESAKIEAAVDGTPGANDMPGRLVFSTTADGAATPTEAMRINNQRELLIGTTTRTANGGVLQVSNGITFPGTQSACSDPNTLDDYEEGTFTPTIRGTGTTGVGTYTSQTGRYTKIGNRVYYTVYLLWTAHTGTADMRIASLPFNSSSVSQSFCAVSLLHQNIAMTAGNTMQANVLVGLAEISLSQVPTGGGAYSNVPLDTAGEIMASGFYEV